MISDFVPLKVIERSAAPSPSENSRFVASSVSLPLPTESETCRSSAAPASTSATDGLVVAALDNVLLPSSSSVWAPGTVLVGASLMALTVTAVESVSVFAGPGVLPLSAVWIWTVALPLKFVFGV
ncbi:MAG: hypothetical protein AVDCRST_MAG85-3417 [uncultured Solirubrobacteraceae bacterium]|uniref:Uncharacterized protein n=1 Tax=uncultured Solirubrobacteraceae bacterium TaxID=1162706 RepID=A0A6J4TNB6_9ACTN|nr:MAG: hypothetical protein AVDCRST_MAG85-3417 [uncultured Solirubrobacteraceae bacterium]